MEYISDTLQVYRCPLLLLHFLDWIHTFRLPPEKMTHVWPPPADMATTGGAPVPKSTAARPSPMVEALPPRSTLSPSPSCP